MIILRIYSFIKFNLKFCFFLNNILLKKNLKEHAVEYKNAKKKISIFHLNLVKVNIDLFNNFFLYLKYPNYIKLLKIN